jgi:hypothetical protein
MLLHTLRMQLATAVAAAVSTAATLLPAVLLVVVLVQHTVSSYACTAVTRLQE